METEALARGWPRVKLRSAKWELTVRHSRAFTDWEAGPGMIGRRSILTSILGACTVPFRALRRRPREIVYSKPYQYERPVPLNLPRDQSELYATFVGSSDKDLTDAVHAVMLEHFADDPRVRLFRFYNDCTKGENIQVRSSTKSARVPGYAPVSGYVIEGRIVRFPREGHST